MWGRADMTLFWSVVPDLPRPPPLSRDEERGLKYATRLSMPHLARVQMALIS